MIVIHKHLNYVCIQLCYALFPVPAWGCLWPWTQWCWATRTVFSDALMWPCWRVRIGSMIRWLGLSLSTLPRSASKISAGLCASSALRLRNSSNVDLAKRSWPFSWSHCSSQHVAGCSWLSTTTPIRQLAGHTGAFYCITVTMASSPTMTHRVGATHFMHAELPPNWKFFWGPKAKKCPLQRRLLLDSRIAMTVVCM